LTRLSVCVFALALLAAPFAFAQAPAPASVPDSTYGEGGTKESVENDKHEVIAETWRDERGIVREQFERDPDGTQYWGFYNGDGVDVSAWRQSMIAVHPMTRPQGRWRFLVIGPGEHTVKELSTITRAELDIEFDYWHTQLRNWVRNAQRQQRENR